MELMTAIVLSEARKSLASLTKSTPHHPLPTIVFVKQPHFVYNLHPRSKYFRE